MGKALLILLALCTLVTARAFAEFETPHRYMLRYERTQSETLDLNKLCDTPSGVVLDPLAPEMETLSLFYRPRSQWFDEVLGWQWGASASRIHGAKGDTDLSGHLLGAGVELLNAPVYIPSGRYVEFLLGLHAGYVFDYVVTKGEPEGLHYRQRNLTFLRSHLSVGFNLGSRLKLFYLRQNISYQGASRADELNATHTGFGLGYRFSWPGND